MGSWSGEGVASSHFKETCGVDIHLSEQAYSGVDAIEEVVICVSDVSPFIIPVSAFNMHKESMAGANGSW